MWQNVQMAQLSQEVNVSIVLSTVKRVYLNPNVQFVTISPICIRVLASISVLLALITTMMPAHLVIYLSACNATMQPTVLSVIRVQELFFRMALALSIALLVPSEIPNSLSVSIVSKDVLTVVMPLIALLALQPIGSSKDSA